MKEILLDEKKTENPDRLFLTIYLGPEEISFSMYDPEEKGSFFYKELTDENQTDPFTIFKDAFFDNTLFSLPFRKVLIMYRTPVFTFVPDEIYKDGNKEDYLQFLFPENQEVILNHAITYAGVNVLYQIPEDVYQFMLRSFSTPDFIHYSTPLITYFLKKVEKADISRMVVNLQKKGLDIFCFSGETFLLGNYFPCNNLTEAVYYILFTWKQLKLNQMNDFLHITGNTVSMEDLIKKLKPYLKNIYSLSVFPEIHFEGVEAEKIPFELAAISSCGL